VELLHSHGDLLHARESFEHGVCDPIGEGLDEKILLFPIDIENDLHHL